MLVDRAELLGADPAIVSEQGNLTYAEVADRAARVGGFLRSIGIEPGDRVATLLPSTIDYLAAWHGTVWAGAIEVPVNVEYKGTFLAHLLRDSGSRALIVDRRWAHRLDGLDVPDLEHVVVLGAGDVPAAFHRFADALACEPIGPVSARDTDTTYVMYTSGTTGPAKGVVHNHRSSFHYIQPWATGLAITPEDVCYSMFPLFHQMGRSACTFAAMWNGIPVVLRDGFSVSGFWDDIRETGATYMGYFGAVLAMLWKQEPSLRDREHRLTRAFGASAPQELMAGWRDRFGVELIEVYGSTEIGLGSGLGSGPPKQGTMGLPCRHVELRIVDENDDPVPPNVIGEAVWRPKYRDSIFQGYWNRPEETIEAWRNLWFHSGDAGYVDREGYFVFVDRMKDTIRRRGENIASFGVEEAVRNEPGVVECAAFAVPSDLAATEEEVMVAVVLARDAEPDPAALFRSLCESMPRHAVPRYLRFMDDLPKTPTLRVQKAVLRQQGVTVDTVDREALGIFPPKE
jgi:crotonobetaine/carnitine-CoA ligase